MARRHAYFTAALAVCLSAVALAQDPDPGYISTFGWGGIAVAQDKAPGLTAFEANLFHYKSGKSFITAGEDTELHCRFLLKEGKTYGQHVAALKKSTAKKAGTLKAEYIRTLFYVSHDEAGSQVAAQWPASLAERPAWKEIGVNETKLSAATGWKSSRFTLSEDRANFIALMSWLKKARPGWKIYVMHVAGYTRDAPELKYYDKAELRWMIPLEYVDTEPLAAATIEVEKSTNPLLAWSYVIDVMPADQKGVKDGRMTVLKDGQKVTTFKFGIQYNYLNKVTKLHNFWVHYEYEDGGVIGGFDASDVPTIEGGIQNTFFAAIQRALFDEKLK